MFMPPTSVQKPMSINAGLAQFASESHCGPVTPMPSAAPIFSIVWLINPKWGLYSQAHRRATATAEEMDGKNTIVRNTTSPLRRWLRTQARASEPIMLMGIASIRNAVLPVNFQNSGSRDIQCPASNFQPRRRTKLSTPTNFGGQLMMSQSKKLRANDASTGIAVNAKNPRTLGAKNTRAGHKIG